MKKLFLLSLMGLSGVVFGADSDSGMETSPVKKAVFVDGEQLLREAASKKHQTTYNSKGEPYNHFEHLCSMHRVNARDAEGMTALHYAVLANRADNVAALLYRCANPNTLNNKNESPLYLARTTGAVDIEEDLRRAGALVDLIGGKKLPKKTANTLPVSRH